MFKELAAQCNLQFDFFFSDISHVYWYLFNLRGHKILFSVFKMAYSNYLGIYLPALC